MKAIRVEAFGGPGVLQVRETPAPEPGPGQVLVRVHAAGVNPVETYIRAGTYAKLPPLPYTPGADAAGRVESLGKGVAHLVVGQRVYVAGSLTGTYAELCLCEAAQVQPLPEAISFAQGAALGVPYATAYRALFQRAQAQRGEFVLIHGGTGGVGLAAVQLARAAGLRVLATGGSEAGRAQLLAEGAETAFDHHRPGYEAEILAATGGCGVDVILEMLANVNLGRDLTLLAPRGRVAVIGSRGPVEINPRDTMAREADIRGVMLFAATPAELQAAHAAIGQGLAQGELNPVVGAQFPLDEAPRAHEAVMASGARGKVVLIL
jgi:NADPH2:quinone reductase